MPGNPIAYDDKLVSVLAREAAPARARRARAARVLVGAGALLVIAVVIAIPAFLLHGLWPFAALPDGSMAALGVLLAGTFKAAAFGLAFALPLGFGAAAYSAQFGSPRLRAALKPALEILEAIPTVVLGLVAAVTLAPWLAAHIATLLALIVAIPATVAALAFAVGRGAQRVQAWLPLALLPLIAAVVAVALAASSSQSPTIAAPTPWNALLVGLALGVAAIPTIFSIAEDALFQIPQAYTHGALALGATRWQALASLIVPAAAPGLLAAALIGGARCIGETMIVLMASGNTPLAALDPLVGLRTVSADIAMTLPEAAPGSGAYRALLLAAFVLFALTLLLNSIAESVRERLRRRSTAA